MSLRFETAEEADYFLGLIENDLKSLFDYIERNPEAISMDSLPDMELYSGPDNPFPSGPNAATKCFEISGTWARLCIVLGWSEEQVIEARAILSGSVYPLSYENLFSGVSSPLF